jgi:hypothetical protein
MTTIIIIVVVALVFFVTVCVVTFMVWKREAEMRTDSIREIKDNLQRLEDRLTVETQPEEPTPLQDDLHDEVCRPVLRAEDPAVAGRACRSRSRSRDPFSWVRSEQEREETSQTEAQQPEEWPQPEPLQQTAEMSIMPDVSETPPQIIPEPEFSLQERKQEPAAEDVAEPGDWDDAMDFDIDLPDGNAAAEMAADDIASMEIELPDLDLFTGLGTLDVNTEETVPADPPKNFGRDTGRSGKKYTAEELEALIKE